MGFVTMGSVLLLTMSAGVGYIVMEKYVLLSSLASTGITFTWQGLVQGTRANSRNGRNYFAFLGIPYGHIPARFELAQPGLKWDGVRNCSTYASMCYQQDGVSHKFMGSEDCLNLNVFTPNVLGKYPVMVWLHGGSFNWDSGNNYSPKNFMDEDVVLITLNFRQGVFGFLDTGDGATHPNIGLKDQILALKWVQENIANFGGDPNRVTLFGQSTGAASVHLHMISPLSEGLFQGAISQSGTALSPWAIQRNPSKMAKDLGALLKCDTSLSVALVDCMRTKSAADIVAAQNRLLKWGQQPYITFGPTVEARYYSGPVFLPDQPINLLSSGRIMNKIPWMLGFNQEETLFFTAPIINNQKLWNDVHHKWEEIAPINFFYDDIKISPQDKEIITRRVQNFYFHKKPPERSTQNNYTMAYLDRFYVSGIVLSTQLHSHASKVFPYMMTFRSNFSYVDALQGPRDRHGPAHLDELHYLFNWLRSPQFHLGTASYVFSYNLVKLWVSFAMHGYPMRTWGSAQTWDPISPGSPLKWYKLDVDTTLVDDPFAARVQFWNNLPLRDYFVS